MLSEGHSRVKREVSLVATQKLVLRPKHPVPNGTDAQWRELLFSDPAESTQLMEVQPPWLSGGPGVSGRSFFDKWNHHHRRGPIFRVPCESDCPERSRRVRTTALNRYFPAHRGIDSRYPPLQKNARMGQPAFKGSQRGTFNLLAPLVRFGEDCRSKLHKFQSLARDISHYERKFVFVDAG
jgi:hypothetical protein